MLIIGQFILVLIHTYQLNGTPYETDCNEKLLENTNVIPDSAFSESSYEENLRGKYSRESSDDDLAWCPRGKISKSLTEFVGIDMGQLCVVKMIMTRGRNAVGYVSAQSYFIKYKLEENSDWRFYRNYSSSRELMGRKDPFNEKFISLDPPLVARWIRIYPFQSSNEKICLKMQLYGCVNTNHVVEYRTVDGSLSPQAQNHRRFKDTSYNGKMLQSGSLLGGTGKLTDRDVERGNTISPMVESARKFVGWDRKVLGQDSIGIDFRFDGPRNFSTVFLRASNHFDREVRIFRKIEIQPKWWFQGRIYNVSVTQLPRESNIELDNRMRANRWINMDIQGLVGNFLQIRLYFADRWIILSEVHFKSEPLNITKEMLIQQLNIDSSYVPETPAVISSDSSSSSSSSDSPKKTGNDNENNSDFTSSLIPYTPLSNNNVHRDRGHVLLDDDSSMTLTQTLGIVCGLLAFIILTGFLALLLFQHGRRRRSWPLKQRCISVGGTTCGGGLPKYAGNNGVFVANESELYSTTKLNKGTFIPFNITPYKYVSSPATTAATQAFLTAGPLQHSTPIKLPPVYSDPPSFLTPSHLSIGSQQRQSQPQFQHLIIRPPPPPPTTKYNGIHSNTGTMATRTVLDNCIYTSLPASDTDSVDTPSNHLPIDNNYYSNRIPSNSYYQTGSPLLPYWSSTTAPRPMAATADNVFCNKSALENNKFADDSAVTFQCHPDLGPGYEISDGIGLVFSNKPQSQDYDSFQTQTWNDSEDDLESLSNHFDTMEHEILDLPGCCGNTTLLRNQEISGSHMSMNGLVNSDDDDDDDDDDAEYGKTEWAAVSGLSGLIGRGLFGQIRLATAAPSSHCSVGLENPRRSLTFGSDKEQHQLREQQQRQRETTAKCRVVKILEENIPSDVRSRFVKETNVSCNLRHRHLARVLVVQLDPRNRTPFVLCEYSSHGDLFSFMQKLCSSNSPHHISDNGLLYRSTLHSHTVPDSSRQLLSPQSIVRMLLQLSMALKYLSKLRLVHRDVACRNCLVFPDNSFDPVTGAVAGDNGITIKLTDIAMSQMKYHPHYVRPSSVAMVITGNQNSVTPAMMAAHQLMASLSSVILPLRWSAPELIVGNRFSEQSDVYAFGVTAWEMFTQCHSAPFPSMTNEQIVLWTVSTMRVVASTPAYSGSGLQLPIPSHCAKELIDFIHQCIHTNPINRPNFSDICTFLANKLPPAR